jgi:hypothetical protein
MSEIFILNSPVVFIRTHVDSAPNIYNKIVSISKASDNSDLEHVETNSDITALFLDLTQIDEEITPSNLEKTYFEFIKGFMFIKVNGDHAKLTNVCFTPFIWSTSPDMENPITELFTKAMKNLGERMTIRTYLNVRSNLWEYFLEALKVCGFQHPVMTINSTVVDFDNKISQDNVKIRFLRDANVNMASYDPQVMAAEAAKLRSKFIISKANKVEEPSTPTSPKAPQKDKYDWMTKTTLPEIFAKKNTRLNAFTRDKIETKKEIKPKAVEISQKSTKSQKVKNVIRDVRAPEKVEALKFVKGRRIYATSFLESINSKLHGQIDLNMRQCQSAVKRSNNL